MRLLERLRSAFNPKSHSATLSHYIPAPDFAHDPVMLSVWRSDLAKRVTDWKGDTGRLYNKQVLSVQGPLLFPVKGLIQANLGGLGVPYGQNVTVPVAGFAGRKPVITDTTYAAEYQDVNA